MRSRPTVLPFLVFLAVAFLAAVPARPGVELREGNILVADAVAKAVILIEPNVTDPKTGKARQTVVYQGLNNPRSLAVDSQGHILVVDEGAGAVYVIDPMTESQDPPKIVRTYNASLIQQPYGLAQSAPGEAPLIYVTLGSGGFNPQEPKNLFASIDPASGVAQKVCPNVYFQAARDLAVTATTALVADYGAAPGNQPLGNPRPNEVENRSRLVKVDLAACTQTDLLCSQLLQRASGVAIAGDGNYYVSDEAGKQILSVNATNGACQVLSKQPQYQGPREIALQSDGKVVMADYVAGRVFVVDPHDGEIVRTFAGGWLKGPNGVFVVGGDTPPPPISGSTLQVP
jgi:hypothetical protein